VEKTKKKKKKKKKGLSMPGAIPATPREYLSAALSETLDDLTDLPADCRNQEQKQKKDQPQTLIARALFFPSFFLPPFKWRTYPVVLVDLRKRYAGLGLALFWNI